MQENIRELKKSLQDVERCIENDGEYTVITLEGLALCGYGRNLPCRYQTEKFNVLKPKEPIYLCGYIK